MNERAMMPADGALVQVTLVVSPAVSDAVIEKSLPGFERAISKAKG